MSICTCIFALIKRENPLYSSIPVYHITQNRILNWRTIRIWRWILQVASDARSNSIPTSFYLRRSSFCGRRRELDAEGIEFREDRRVVGSGQRKRSSRGPVVGRHHPEAAPDSLIGVRVVRHRVVLRRSVQCARVRRGGRGEEVGVAQRTRVELLVYSVRRIALGIVWRFGIIVRAGLQILVPTVAKLNMCSISNLVNILRRVVYRSQTRTQDVFRGVIRKRSKERPTAKQKLKYSKVLYTVKVNYCLTLIESSPYEYIRVLLYLVQYVE